MFISPNVVIAEGWIKFPDWMTEEQRVKCIQPNAIDFTVDAVHTINNSVTAKITEQDRSFRPLFVHPLNSASEWRLESGVVYDGTSDFFVTVPDNVVAWLKIRSSFNRVGMQLTSGLYDSGFQGNIGFTMCSHCGPVITAPHTRVGQIIFAHSDAAGTYSGGFNTPEGKHWTTNSFAVKKD